MSERNFCMNSGVPPACMLLPMPGAFISVPRLCANNRREPASTFSAIGFAVWGLVFALWSLLHGDGSNAGAQAPNYGHNWARALHGRLCRAAGLHFHQKLLPPICRVVPSTTPKTLTMSSRGRH